MDIVTQEIVDAHWIQTSIAPIIAPSKLFNESNLAENEATECLVTRAAYDIGSNATKTMAATVNVCNMTLENVFINEAYPVLYRQDLFSTTTNEFSDLIQSLGLQTIFNARNQIEQEYDAMFGHQHGDIEHCAVATAAFRSANNGENFVHYLSTTLDFPVNIISKEDEGKLAYFSALTKLDSDEAASLPVVWDIGGGSMQLTYKNEANDFFVMGGEVASQTFQALVLEHVVHKELSETPHPLNESQVQEAIALAKKHLVFDEVASSLIHQKIDQGTSVIAVGSVHNQVIQPLCNLATHQEASFYTKSDLLQAIGLLTNKTDQEILGFMEFPNEQFVKNQLTNLILVYAMMDMMGIEKVQTMQTSNVEGLLLKGC
jgi:exopolyphosphatase/guanosine-5'-triphosphate,3'-diphosphate pyrophosphatase